MKYFRLGKIQNLIIHHTAGNDMNGWTDEEVIDFLSNVGYSRGYKKYGYDKTTGYSPVYGRTVPMKKNYNDEPCFAMYHYSIRPDSKSKNGYRFLQIIKDPEKYNVNSTSNYEINKHSLSLNFAGNYTKKHIDKEAVKLMIYSLSDMYKKYKFEVRPHNSIDKTACPGTITELISPMQIAFYIVSSFENIT